MAFDRTSLLASSAGLSGPYGGANILINGDFRIDQRNAGASVNCGAGVLPVDRWYQNQSGSMTGTMQRLSASPPPGANFYLRYTATNANTPSGAEYSYVVQRVEGLNTLHLSWGTAGAKSVTFSIYLRSSLTGDFGFAITNGTGATTYPFLLNIPVANTWTLCTKTITGDTAAAWAKDNTTSLGVHWCPGVGTTYKGAANAWSGSNLVGVTGQVMLTSTNGATFDMTSAKLEVGSIATPFVPDDYTVSLMKCFRYYEKQIWHAANYTHIGFCTYAGHGYVVTQYTPKRALPAITFPTAGSGSGQFTAYDSTENPVTAGTFNPANATPGLERCRVDMNGFTGLDIGLPFALYVNAAGAGQAIFAADAEL